MAAVSQIAQMPRTTALRRAAVQAVRAPSVHNTQPWRFHLTPRALEVHADWTRRLPLVDARGRQLVISGGCALLNARAALAAEGHATRVERFPDPSRPGLLARVTLLDSDGAAPEADLAPLDAAVAERRTNRSRFLEGEVPAELLAELVRSARAEGAALVVLTEAQRRAAARLSRRADEISDGRPGFRAELATAIAARRPLGSSEEPEDGGSGPDRGHRGPETLGTGFLPEYESVTAGALLVLATRHDTPLEWLRTGEAMERVLLELTLAGHVASSLMRVTEVRETNDQLRTELGVALHPQGLLRAGLAGPVPATRRRRLADVLSEAR